MDDNDSNDYLTKVQLFDVKNRRVFYDKLTYYYIEMPKFKKKKEELSTHLEYWMWYLNNLVELEEIPKKLKEDEVLKQAFDVAKFLALSKDKQLAYQLDLKAKLDYQNVLDYAIEYAKEEGMEKGMEKGERKKQLEIAKNLLDVLNNETIALKTGLSIEEIKELRG